jgi:Fanconi anemia group D2 protein
MQSILNSIAVLLEKSVESNGKNMHVGCSKEIIPFLRKHLAASAHKLLTSDFPTENAENGWQNKVSYNTMPYTCAGAYNYKHTLVC